jgi:hypothetical protein
MNTGLEDARNLAWKLAATRHGWGSEALLDSYEAERRPVSRSTSADFIERMIVDGRHFLTHHDPEVDREDFESAWERRKEGSLSGVSDFEPHYEDRRSCSPRCAGAVGSHQFTARPSHHLGRVATSSIVLAPGSPCSAAARRPTDSVAPPPRWGSRWM